MEFNMNIVWQDVLLFVIGFVFLVRMTYRMGYADGMNKQRYIHNQEELEKSGNFFWCHGHRFPYPPRPEVEPKKEG